MDPSGEVADLLVKEGLQATEVAAKLAAEGIKNAAALIAALAKGVYAQTQPPSGRQQQRLCLLSDKGQRRDGLYCQLCKDKGA